MSKSIIPNKIILLFLLFCLYGKAVFSQRVVVDELLPAISLKTFSISNTEKLLEVSEAYLIVNTDSSLLYANNALSCAKKMGNKELEADSYIAMGQSYDYINQQTIALEYFLEARNIYEEIKNDSGLAVTFYSIGEMYNTLKETQTARMNFHKSLRLFTALKNEGQMANIYGSLANTFYKSRQYDSAQFYNKLGLAIGRQKNDTAILQDILGNMADVLIAQGKFEEAIIYLTEANRYADVLGNFYGVAYGKRQLAMVALAKKEYNTVMQLTNDIIAIGRKLNMDDLLMEAAELRYKMYKQLDNTDSALFYMEKYTLLADTLTGRNKYYSLDSLLNTYRFGKKQKEVELLKQTNKSNAILLLSSCFALLVTGSFLFFIYRRSKERKTMNDLLKDQTSKLQSINYLKDKMFSIIGHDLRGPVASLKGLVDFMKTNSLSNEDSEMVVKELKQSVNSVDMLLENLLVWAKVQMQGDIISKPEPLNTAVIIDEAVQLYLKPASQKEIELRYEIENDLLVFADRNYLSLILRNLINNAIKFTPHNGKVNITAFTQGHQTKLCVQDNGIGMDKEEIEKLFNLDKPFTKRGTMNERGSGLGLLFVKEYTERCGGTFSITSEKSNGSKFCITLNKA